MGRIRIGPWTTPWVANACLSLDGERHRLGGLGKTRAVEVDEAAERARFTLPGDGIVVRGEVAAPRRELVVGWVYSDPEPGSRHHTAHCAIADMTLTVERPGQPPRTLTARAGATYELGMREQTTASRSSRSRTRERLRGQRRLLLALVALLIANASAGPLTSALPAASRAVMVAV